ncbi:MAG TPA: hypothetical protein VMV83_16480 [Rectinemataceae bacterium]|nr:hypothetical protein [Rectinemataceae bacterium]
MESSGTSALFKGVASLWGDLAASLPSILSTLALLAIGSLAVFGVGKIAEAIARNAAVPNVRAVGRTFRVIVSVLVGLAVLDRLGFSRSLLGIIFLISIGAVVLAFAIAFGLGAISLAKKAAEEVVPDLRKGILPELPRDEK